MDFCNLTDLPEDLLSAMTCLESFRMILVNGFRTLIRIRNNFFANNRRLKMVSIQRSSKMELDSELFSGLKLLEELDLADSNFTVVPILRPPVKRP